MTSGRRRSGAAMQTNDERIAERVRLTSAALVVVRRTYAAHHRDPDCNDTLRRFTTAVLYARDLGVPDIDVTLGVLQAQGRGD